MEDERLRQQAVAERERGNALFKAGKYDQAVEKYTAGHYLLRHAALASGISPILPCTLRAMSLAFYFWVSCKTFCIKIFESVNLTFFMY